MGFISLDTETTGLNFWRHHIFGYSYSRGEHDTLYQLWKDRPEAINELLWSNESIVFQNAKFDIHMLMNEGFDIPKHYHDTMLMSYVYDENKRHSLADIAHNYLGVPKWKDEVRDYVQKNKCTYEDVPFEIMKPYAVLDALRTWQCAEFLYPKIVANPSLLRTYERERELLRHMVAIEQYGVKIDVSKLDILRAELTKEIEDATKKIYFEADCKFNINSEEELANVLFTKLGLPPQGRTEKSGQYKVDNYVLENLNHSIILPLSQYRLATKMLDTYCNNINDLVDSNNILHCDFLQHGTRTGRFSCRTPNLQNIPKKHRVRELFVPREGFKWYFFDWKQMEMRLYAHFAHDRAMMKLFDQGIDPYRENAKVYYEKSEVTKEERNFIKGFTLGILYGMGVRGITKRYHKTQDEAYKFRNKFNYKFPLMRKFSKDTIKKVNEQGYIENPFGRRRHLASDKTYLGMNSLIQGTGGDMMKECIIKVSKLLSTAKSKAVLSIHDELIVEVHDSEPDCAPEIKKIMEDFPQFDLPMPIDVEVTTTNWKEKIKWDLKI